MKKSISILALLFAVIFTNNLYSTGNQEASSDAAGLNEVQPVYEVAFLTDNSKGLISGTAHIDVKVAGISVGSASKPWYLLPGSRSVATNVNTSYYDIAGKVTEESIVELKISLPLPLKEFRPQIADVKLISGAVGSTQIVIQCKLKHLASTALAVMTI